MNLKNLVDIVVAKIRDKRSRYLPKDYFQESTRLFNTLKNEDPHSEGYAQAVDDFYLFSRRIAKYNERISGIIEEISRKYPESKIFLEFLEQQKETSKMLSKIRKKSELFRERYYQWRRGEIPFGEVLESLIAGTKNRGIEND